MVENLLEITLQNRKNLHKVLTNTPKEKLLAIPEGFNNNIFWNIAHTVVTQQLLCYKFSGLQMRVPKELVDKFMKGTVPDGTASDEEIMMVADFLISTVEWIKEDYETQLFKEYKEYTTSAKVTLRNVEDAIGFNLFHEGLHANTITLLLKHLG
ncbi:DinB superfamily protein [Maribacter sedimenticola]|uniref:DinB superfamily protein n=1 Tax=Maribacter sedimenticola TaxID=228956 RepID=A0ABY1SJ88_9FLAO|nr:DinB family protein [Maribacter sedimenticola]SNR57421.1 DinB superfamily protein [Maribacter sedimenticola]